ncbi:hypothetical protein V1264_022909 [Littorina saxatilis]|uniref:RanBP2-type domain-containing protein n=2 Tax=Littorina saxatilis TaxID=31220 RepID=A0AAN9B670_9CAEN
MRERRFFGLTRNDLMKMAYQIAEMNRINHSFNKEKKTAGKDWYRLFKRRHPEISLRQPEATSFARAEGFNREAVNRYFNLLEELVDDNSLHASRIFNMDKTGISTVQKKCQKVLAQKGKHQIGSMSSGERGVNTTLVVCASAAGNYVPPFVIFKRKRMPPSLAEGSPVGSVVTCNDSGWMDGNMFYSWLQHFIKHVKPNVEEKVLIVLDGHKSHTSNLDAINLAREHGVILLSLPPHTTHKTQPMDRSVFKPLQAYYDQAIERWLRNNPGRLVTPFQICSLFNEAYLKTATMQTAMNGFRSCGIWPCSREVFEDSQFEASITEALPSLATLSSSHPETCSMAHLATGNRTNVASSNRTNDASSDRTNDAFSNRTNDAFSNRTNDAFSNRTNDASSDRTNDASSDRTNDAFSNRTNDASSDRTNDAFSNRTNDAFSNRTNDAFSNRTDDASSDRTNDAFSNRTNDASSDRTNDAFSNRTNDAFSDRSNDATGNRTNDTSSDKTNGATVNMTNGATEPMMPPATGSMTHAATSPTTTCSVINPASDGRCFFRSLVISADTDLQTARRINGQAIDPGLRLREQAEADNLRNKVMLHIITKIDDHAQNLVGDTLNADMPQRIRFSSVHERVMAMSVNTAMVGEFEIQQTSEVLKKTIVIIDATDNRGNTLKYGEEFEHPVTLRYTSWGDEVGHYELVVTTGNVLPTPSSRRRKRTSSEVLTSSPYKKLLEEKAKGVAKKTKKTTAKKTTAKKTTAKKTSDGYTMKDWLCILCGEYNIENMIRCRSCEGWAHIACAGTNTSDYVCDFCC